MPRNALTTDLTVVQKKKTVRRESDFIFKNFYLKDFHLIYCIFIRNCIA